MGHAVSLRLLALLPAGAALAASLVLAWHHPLWPLAALLCACLWSALAAWHQRLWMFALPLGAAALNFSPWTGWVVFDECDLLLLSTLAGAYARLALQARPVRTPLPAALRTLLLGMAAVALLGLVRGWLDAQGADGGAHAGRPFDWFAGYTDAPNSLRVAKSELYALLLVPLWPRTPQRLRPLAWGLVAGLSVVVCAVLWERLAFPGLLNFDAPYRSVALFWEMHVGGEALDGYLALATPFVVWVLMSARRPWHWGAAALLAVLTLYALLTTFSRGVYAAVLSACTLLGLLLLRQGAQLPGWRARAAGVLALLLVAEVAAVVGGGSFLWQRVAATRSDLGSRVQHWRRGLGTLHGASDWWLGLGLGRLPAHYAASGPAGEFSGSAGWATQARAHDPVRSFATLRGPATRQTLGGQFALAQRTRSAPQGTHTLRLTLRVAAHTELMVQWCERHLLFDGHCQTALLQARPGPTAWQTQVLQLSGDAPGKPAWRAPRAAYFTLSVVNAGGQADVAQLLLQDTHGNNLLDNATFQQGLAQWPVLAQSYFLPWHIDNLLLELLIERGLLGLLLFATLLGAALWQLTRDSLRGAALAPYQAAALLGTLCVGASGSLLDVPRVALLLYVLALDALVCGPYRAIELAVACEKSMAAKGRPHRLHF
jgi:O-antigen ligase